MKTLTRLFAALLLTAGLCAVPAGAANQVERLTTDVALEQDGLAHVTQVFSAQTDEGTEFYMDRLTSGRIRRERPLRRRGSGQLGHRCVL